MKQRCGHQAERRVCVASNDSKKWDEASGGCHLEVTFILGKWSFHEIVGRMLGTSGDGLGLSSQGGGRERRVEDVKDRRGMEALTEDTSSNELFNILYIHICM